MFRYLTLIFSLSTFVKSDQKWHTSQTSLVQLYDLQKEHFNAFDSYINAETKRLEELKNHLAEIHNWHNCKLMDENGVYADRNHMNGFAAMKEIQLHMRKIENFTINVQSAEALKVIDSDKDLSGDHVTYAIQGLRRLQKFYEIPAPDMAEGRYNGRIIGDQMNACECYFMAMDCFTKFDLYGSIDWAFQAHDKWAADGNPKCIDIEKLKNFMVIYSFPTGRNCTTDKNVSNGTRYSEKEEHFAHHISLVRNDVTLIDQNEKKSSLDLTYGFDAYRWYKSCIYENEFKHLCKHGETIRTLTEYSRCRYQTKNSTYRMLMPFKEEDVHDDPHIKIYHDVLYDDEIETIKTTSKKNMVDSTVVATKEQGGRLFDERHRSGKTSRIKYIEGSLDNRIECFTGQNTQTAEPYQIVNYGLCGHYMPHTDAFYKRNHLTEKLGNRIVTVLFYLNDVQNNGYTVFPMLNIVSPVEKGAALVWYNVHTSNGSIHEHTLHGSCPMLKGNKWIMTRWLYEEGQFLNYDWKKLQTD